MKYRIFIMATILVFVSCKHSSVSSSPDESNPVVTQLSKTVIAADNSFGLKLFSHISQNESDKNVFISPLSVSMAFGMTLNGAAGTTLDSMKFALEHSGFTMDEINASYENIYTSLTSLDTKVVFQIANSIWYKNTFPVLDTFRNVCQQYFNAEITALDFSSPSAVATINNWVNEKTNGKIPTIIDNIPPSMVMYLINAIYFKGTWTYQFKPEATSTANFTTGNRTGVTCQLMSQKSKYAYYADSTMQVIDLPYGDRKFSMTIILPRFGTSIDQFANALTQSQWQTLISKLDSSTVDLYLPKFKLEYTKELKDELTAMGMGIAFTDRANFTHIAPMGLCISTVLHKTYVEVNEEGTEAAAVTAIGVETTAVQVPSNPVMRIDHPFIFAIREHQSGTILFIGKIVNPNQ